MEQIGIIDVGSNSTRLVVFQIGTGRFFRVTEDLKEPLRLGEGMGSDRLIKEEKIRQAIDTLKTFQNLCSALQVKKIRAVGTAALRAAANQREFLSRVKEETGLVIEVLSGREEAYYDYVAVINSMDVNDGIIADVGGGSTELVLVRDGKMTDSASLPFGALTLTQKFGLRKRVGEEQEAALKEFLHRAYREIPWLSGTRHSSLIGVGGTARNIGKIDRRQKKYPLDITHNYQLTAEDLQKIFRQVKSKTLGERKKTKGLSRDRADIFVGAAAILSALTDIAGVEEMLISGYGLREGLVYTYLNERGIGANGDVLQFSIDNLLAGYNVNRAHAWHVCGLVQSMYHQLQELHRQSPETAKVLKTAALLHDCGINIRYYSHQKHSFYMILNSGLNGLTHRELLMSALTSAASRKDGIKIDSNRYAQLLDDQDLITVLRMGVLLRIGESLDRTMDGIVSGVLCRIRGERVIIEISARGNARVQVSDALKAGDHFKRVYGKKLTVVMVNEPDMTGA